MRPGSFRFRWSSSREYLNRIEFFGTDGAIRVDHRGEVFLAKNGESEWTADRGRDLGRPIPDVPDTGFSRGFMEFAPKIVEAIRDGKNEIEYAATFDDGLKVQRVLDAARESNASADAWSALRTRVLASMSG